MSKVKTISIDKVRFKLTTLDTGDVYNFKFDDLCSDYGIWISTPDGDIYVLYDNLKSNAKLEVEVEE